MISAIVLAAGQSKRMGKTKQLLTLGNKTLIEHVVDNVLASRVAETVVVIGHDANAIKGVLKNRPVKLALNQNYLEGMGTSVRAAMDQVSPAAQGVLIVLGDQPGITGGVIDQVVSNFSEGKGSIIVPVHKGRRGNPVLFDIKYKSELIKLSGDVGAREVVIAHPDDVYEVDVGSEGILEDIDTEQDYKRYAE